MSAARNPFRTGPRLSDSARAELVGKRAAPVSAHRRSMIGKVHVAKRELGLIEDDYRSILLAETGQISLTTCSDAQIAKLLDRLKSQGFTPKKAVRAADHPGAGKARALWISLGQLGAIENASEQALEAFARRQMGCDRLQFANQRQIYKLVEALKAIAERHGWDQKLDGIATAAAVVVLKRRLIDAQMTRLRDADWVGADWCAVRAARAFAGVEVQSFLGATLTELDSIAQALGTAIADARKAGALK
ncbi:regulatory protein GemA [Sphingomonas sp.]|uniref:gp16 family protein n=1 Tax=Sphingomonas sp. TaxID=28214 RepID=UPI00307F5347